MSLPVTEPTAPVIVLRKVHPGHDGMWRPPFLDRVLTFHTSDEWLVAELKEDGWAYVGRTFRSYREDGS